MAVQRSVTTIMSLRPLLLLALATFLAACSTVAPELDQAKTGHLTPDQFRAHVLMFDSLGGMRDPINTSGKPPQQLAHVSFARLGKEESRIYIDRIIGEIRERRKHGPVKLLFFFHGGLNTRAAALARAANHIQRMQHDEPDIYPIFVNWQTSLTASYKDHLFWIRKGHDTSNWGLVLTPVQAVTDLARTVLESPVAYYLHLTERRHSYQYKDTEKVGSIATECPDPKLYFHEGVMTTAHTPPVRDFVQSSLISPLTLVASGLIDAAGSSAWGTMIYTSDSLFWSPREVHHPYDYDPSEAGYGGLSQFLDRLSDVLDDRDEITIVAHSAGAVVANKFVANFSRRLPIRNLVYMAPACPIDDLMPGGKLVEFLRENSRRKLYILTLHEKAELEEEHWLRIPPRGSLLVWLDEVIQPKNSEFAGVMLGRARNLRLHAHLIPCDIQDRVRITSFNDDITALPWEQPQMHGQFGSLPYWGYQWWEPGEHGIAGLTQIKFTRTPNNP